MSPGRTEMRLPVVTTLISFNRGGRGFVVGRHYGGHVWYGHNRHRWHGAWYEYGVGPCWINVDGEWFWNVLVCPP